MTPLAVALFAEACYATHCDYHRRLGTHPYSRARFWQHLTDPRDES